MGTVAIIYKRIAYPRDYKAYYKDYKAEIYYILFAFVHFFCAVYYRYVFMYHLSNCNFAFNILAIASAS